MGSAGSSGMSGITRARGGSGSACRRRIARGFGARTGGGEGERGGTVGIGRNISVSSWIKKGAVFPRVLIDGAYQDYEGLAL